MLTLERAMMDLSGHDQHALGPESSAMVLGSQMRARAPVAHYPLDRSKRLQGILVQ
jgi:hypothetical protein